MLLARLLVRLDILVQIVHEHDIPRRVFGFISLDFYFGELGSKGRCHLVDGFMNA